MPLLDKLFPSRKSFRNNVQTLVASNVGTEGDDRWERCLTFLSFHGHASDTLFSFFFFFWLRLRLVRSCTVVDPRLSISFIRVDICRGTIVRYRLSFLYRFNSYSCATLAGGGPTSIEIRNGGRMVLQNISPTAAFFIELNLYLPFGFHLPVGGRRNLAVTNVLVTWLVYRDRKIDLRVRFHLRLFKHTHVYI